MNISILGMNIKNLRELKGISAYRLAKEANVGASTISEIESGIRQSLNSASMRKIAEALEVSIDELLRIEDNEEIIVRDLPQTLHYILTSDEATLDDIEMTEDEKEFYKKGSEYLFDHIRYQRLKKANLTQTFDMAAEDSTEYGDK